MYTILLSAGWPIWPLLIISIIGLAIVIERAWYLRKIQIFPAGSLETAFTLATQLESGKTVPSSEIERLARLSPAMPLLTSVLQEKLSGSSSEAALEELQAIAQATWHKLERYLGPWLPLPLLPRSWGSLVPWWA